MRFFRKLATLFTGFLEKIHLRKRTYADSSPQETSLEPIGRTDIQSFQPGQQSVETLSPDFEVVSPSKPKVNVTVEIEVPEDTDVNVNIAVKPTQKNRKHQKHGSNYSDGVTNATDDDMAWQYFVDSTETYLDTASQAQFDIPWEVDKSLQYYVAYEKMLEQHRYPGRNATSPLWDERSGNSRPSGSEKIDFEFIPSLSQMHRYYTLCRLCDDNGISYNRDVHPENSREFQLAIIALTRLLHQNGLGGVIVKRLGRIPHALCKYPPEGPSSALHQKSASC